MTSVTATQLQHQRADLNLFFSPTATLSVPVCRARAASHPTLYPSLARGFPPRRALQTCGRTSINRNLFSTLALSQTQASFQNSRVPVRESFPTFALSQTRTPFQPRRFLTPARPFPTCLSDHPSVVRLALKSMSNLIFIKQIPR